jgi:hypothetical protein
MSLTFTVVFIFATCFCHIWAINQANFCYCGDHCTVNFAFCALRHIVVLLFASFLEYYHCILLAAIPVFYVVFLLYVSFWCCLPIYSLSLYIWLYSPLDLDRFFSFLIYTQSVGLLGRVISRSQGRYLHTGQHKHSINAHRHRCLDWDSNPRSQCYSGRRRFML